jgi:hypothetical protein
MNHLLVDYLDDVLSRYHPGVDRENLELEELVIVWHNSYASKDLGNQLRQTILSFFDPSKEGEFRKMVSDYDERRYDYLSKKIEYDSLIHFASIGDLRE